MGALRDGLVVVLPTDTLYGLCADPFNPRAVDRVFALKQRPRDVALPVLLAEPGDAGAVGDVSSPLVQRLIEAFWPGALTIVVPRRDDVAIDVGKVEGTIAVRCPDHDVLRAVTTEAGPIAVTSANLHGQPTPETAAEVAAQFGDGVAVVVDGGPCTGQPSTVVDCTGDGVRVLREGRLPWGEIERVLAEG